MSDQAAAAPASVVQAPASQVAGGRAPLSGAQKIGICAMVGVVVVAAMVFRGAGGDRQAHEPPMPATSVGSAGADFKAPPLVVPAAPVVPASLPMQSVNLNPAQRNQVDPMERARASDILGGNAASVPASLSGTAAPAVAAPAGGESAGPLGELLKPTMLQGSKAARLPHPDLTITMGTPFPCIPQQPITSDAPGLVTCIVPVDVRGTTGRVVLLDRGTKVVGTVQASLLQGHSRLFVLWQRAETPNPNHVIINLNSPAADQLGEAGLGGDINTHFWQRFGGAIMLSFIDSGLQAAAAAASSAGGNGSISFNSFSSGGQNAAATALQSTVNIPPTLRRDQALPATVFVARDLDFSDVYGLAVRQ